MSDKAKRTMWRLYWTAFGALCLVSVLCMTRAQAICNVPPYGQVDITYSSNGSNVYAMFVAEGGTNLYSVYVTSNAPMKFKSEDTNIFMFVSNGIPMESVISCSSLTITGLMAGVTNISTWSTTNSGTSYDVTCGVIQVTVTKPIYVTDFFTPRQEESPPYHVCKVDYGGSTNFPGGTPSQILFQVKESTNEWTNIFYKIAIQYSSTPLADTNLYGLTNRYCVTNLYSGTNMERICWDGRKDADGDGTIDSNSAGKAIWANRPVNTGTNTPEVVYDVRVGVSYLLTNGTTMTNFVIGETRTCPLQLDSDNLPMMGPAPYFGLFRDQINSRYDTILLDEPSMFPKSDGRPVPGLTCYYSGNDWGHTTMGFGWSHNYDVKVLPVYTNGERAVYLQWNGDHLLGPVDSSNHLWIVGERADLCEGTNGWVMTNRLKTVYTFDSFGQLSEIQDKNSNKVVVTMSLFDTNNTNVLIRRVDKVELKPNGGSGSNLTLKLSYDSAGTSLTNATLGGRSMVFSYFDATNAYGTNYAADEVISEIFDSEYTNKFGMGEGRRENPASRVICGPMTNRIVGDIQHNFTFSPEEELTNVVVQAKVSEYNIGGSWRKATISSNSAIYGSTNVTHTYGTSDGTQNKLKTIDIDSHTYAFEYDDKGNRKQVTGAGGLITTNSYDYDPSGTGVGNLTKVSPPDYSEISYEYNTDWNVATKVSVATPARETDYEMDGCNIKTKTEKGDGAGLDDRKWTYVYRADGSVSNVVDPTSKTSTYTYSGAGDSLGLPSKIVRESVNLLDCSYDNFGNVTTNTDAEGNTFSYTYDNWDRVKKKTYPIDSDTEEWSYRSLNDLTMHKLPKGGSGNALVVTNTYGTDGKLTGGGESGTGVNHTYTYTVDNEGNITDLTLKDGSTSWQRKYTYDYANRMTKETWASTDKGAWEYDLVGSVIKETDAAVFDTTYDYFSDGAIKTVTRPSGLGSITYSRDGVGNVLSVEDDPGTTVTPKATTTYTYDSFNRAITITDPRGKNWTNTYDSLDNLVATTTPKGKTTTSYYNDKNYRDKIELPDGKHVDEVRDDNGNVTSMTDARGKTWASPRDPLQRVEKFAPPASSPTSGAHGRGKEGPSVPRAFGPPTERYEGGHTITQTVDSAGRITSSSRSGVEGAIAASFNAVGLKDVTSRANVKTIPFSKIKTRL